MLGFGPISDAPLAALSGAVRTFANTHLTQTLIRLTDSRQHNASSFLIAGLIDVHQTRAVLRAGLTNTHQARSVLSAGFSDTHLTNSLLLGAGLTVTHLANSLLKAGLTNTHLARSVLRAGFSDTHLTDSLLQAAFSDSHQARSLLIAGFTDTHLTNSLLKSAITRTHQTIAFIGAAGVTISHQTIAALISVETILHNTDGLLLDSFNRSIITESSLTATIAESLNTNALLESVRFISHATLANLNTFFSVSQNVLIYRMAANNRYHYTNNLLQQQLFQSHASASLLKATPLNSANTDALKIANIANYHYVDAGLSAVGLRPHLVDGLVRQTFNLSHTTQTTQTITPLKQHNTSGLKISTSLRAHDTGGLVRNSYDLSQILSFKLVATNSIGHTAFTRLTGDRPNSREHYNNSVILGAFAADHSVQSSLGKKSQTAVHYATALLLRFNEAVVRNVFKAFRSESVGKFIPLAVDLQRPNATHTNRIVLRKNGWGILDIAAKDTLLNNHQVDYRNTCSKVDIIARVGDNISPDIRAIWGACLDNIDHSASPGFDAQDLAAPGVAPLLQPVVIEPPKPRQIFSNVNISPIRVKRGPESKTSEPAPIVIQRAIQDAPAPATIPEVMNFGEVKKKSPPPKIWKNTEKILKMPR